jgi:hypothetical protein
MQYFELKRINEISPSTGEDLGEALTRFAFAEEDRFRATPNARVSNWSFTVAQLLYLAAEAFEQGASVSIGRKRADRYDEAGKELRRKAAVIEAEGKAEREETESASLLAAFDEGFAGRDITRYSFDRREAALVGQLFAKEGRERPKRLNKVYSPRPLARDSERDHLVDDLGQKFIVDYPDGKIKDAIVTKI